MGSTPTSETKANITKQIYGLKLEQEMLPSNYLHNRKAFKTHRHHNKPWD
jgi:hypothetical protein